jgi:methylated-DNA-protein-cysteine methyltransferase-like protein
VAKTAFDEVYRIVKRIPRGRVMTYGQIADSLTRTTLSPKAIGWAMHSCPPDLPWHRVVNAQGRCSADRLKGTSEQQARLEAEGVRFEGGAIDLERYRHRPRRRASAKRGAERPRSTPPADARSSNDPPRRRAAARPKAKPRG